MPSMSPGRPYAGPAALSIDVEDWFHAANLQVAREAWSRCEPRVERNTMRILDILDFAKAKATFFVLGWVAERCPQLVRRMVAAGHEVASHGHGHHPLVSLDPSAFRADL